MKEDICAGGIHGDAQECLTPHSGSGDVTPYDQGSPMSLAQRPLEITRSVHHSSMSSPTIGTAPTIAAFSRSSTDGSQLGNSPPSGKKVVPREPNPMPAAKRLRVGDPKAAPIEVDDPGLRVSRAKAGRDLHAIRALQLQWLPDDYTPGARSFVVGALSLHALRGQTPLHGADLRVQATIMYR